MELIELSFTHFWNGYPQEHLQEEMACTGYLAYPFQKRALMLALTVLFLCNLRTG